MSPTDHTVQDLDWLVTDFVERVRDVAHAVVVSADGLPLAYNARFPRDHADQLAAVTSGLASLTQGAARVFSAGRVIQTAVEMEAGLFVVMSISNGSSLGALAAGPVGSASHPTDAAAAVTTDGDAVATRTEEASAASATTVLPDPTSP